MRQPRSRFSLVIFSLAVALATTSVRAQTSSGTSGSISGEVYQRERANHQQSLLIDVHGAPFDEVIVDTPKKLRDKGSVGYSTGDWKWETDGALRFYGPGATSLRARIDYPTGTKLPDHLPVKINYLGSTLFSGKYDVTRLPALQEPAGIGDMATFPGHIEFDQPFTFHTSLPDPRNLDVRFIPDTSDVPLKLRLLLNLGDGKMWTTGVHREEPRPEGEESHTIVHLPDRSVRIDNAEVRDRWGELVAKGNLDMSIWPEVHSTAYSVDWASIVPRLGLTYSLGSDAGTLLKSNYAQYADQMYSGSTAELGGPAYAYAYAYIDKDQDTVGSEPKPKPDGQEPFDLFVDSYACFGFRDNNGNGKWDRDELAFPDDAWTFSQAPMVAGLPSPGPGIGALKFAGDGSGRVVLREPILKDKLWWFGSWPIRNLRRGSQQPSSGSTPNTDTASTPRRRFGRACGDPDSLLSDRPVLRDRNGRIRGAGTPITAVSTRDIDEIPARSILPLIKLQPGVIQAPEMGLVGENYCVCGDVPNISAWNGLQMGGRPLGAPLAATAHSATFQLPNDLPPGPQSVNWVNLPDGDGSGSKTVLIKVEGSIDQNKLLRGEATQLQLRVRGTEKQLPFQLQNFTPGIVSLEGGNKQTVTTSGGSDNVVRRQVQALNPGNFNIQYEFDLGKCPCSAPPSDAVKQTSNRTLADMAKDLGSILDDSDNSQARPNETPSTGIIVNDRTPDLPPTWVRPSLPFDCSINDRFRVRVEWSTPDGEYGRGRCASQTGAADPNTAKFYFFDDDNTELLVKVLDQCDLNNRFWVFYGATTNVEYNLTVTDPKSGQTRHWLSPSSERPLVQDTHAFDTCP